MTLARLDMEMSDVFTYSNIDSDSAASAIVATCSNSATGSSLPQYRYRWSDTDSAGGGALPVVTLTVQLVELYLE